MTDETIDDELFQKLTAAVPKGTVVETLKQRAPNTVLQWKPEGALVETGRTRQKAGQGKGELIPAHMFNDTWRELTARGSLSLSHLRDEMKVMRASGICAILAHLPEVEVEPGRDVRLVYKPGART